MEGLEGGVTCKGKILGLAPREDCARARSKGSKPARTVHAQNRKIIRRYAPRARKIQAFRIRLYLVCFWQRRERRPQLTLTKNSGVHCKKKKKKRGGGGLRKNEKKTYNFVELKNEHQYNLNKLLITSGFFSPSFFSSSFL